MSDKIRYVNFRPGLDPCPQTRAVRDRARLWPLALAACLLAAPVLAAPPSVVFILLDTTRADRLGAWGGPNPTSPNLDGLAASGVRFAAHFANAHATRPSMPQLMSGRYYHQNILRAFTPDDHPREFPFSRDDPTAVLLPALLRARGFQTVAVSSHPWVSPESALGKGFETFELLAAAASRGHAGAAEVVDHGVAAWQRRDRSRPTFLYLHFMDAHMPRFLPAGEPRFAVPGYDWHRRFRPDGEPAFDRPRRDWNRYDASDFSELDRRYFAAVYDTLLAFMDEQLGRLFAALRADDPGLARTVVVVVADHGEELAEDGRIGHDDSLTDTVQHVPWIMAGAGIRPGQVVNQLTENIDVMPTLLARLDEPLPPGTRVDGRAQLAADGSACPSCGKLAAFYAWEDYRAIRARRHLLRENLPGSFRARCDGADQLFALDDRRRALAPATPVAERLRRHLHRRLDAPRRTFLSGRYGTPTSSVVLRPEFWSVEDDPAVACVPVNGDTPASALRAPGWLWTEHGLALLERDGAPSLAATVDLPDGGYVVELASVPVARMPWLIGFASWRRTSFAKDGRHDLRPDRDRSRQRGPAARRHRARRGPGPAHRGPARHARGRRSRFRRAARRRSAPTAAGARLRPVMQTRSRPWTGAT